MATFYLNHEAELYHYGVKGMKWGKHKSKYDYFTPSFTNSFGKMRGYDAAANGGPSKWQPDLNDMSPSERTKYLVKKSKLTRYGPEGTFGRAVSRVKESLKPPKMSREEYEENLANKKKQQDLKLSEKQAYEKKDDFRKKSTTEFYENKDKAKDNARAAAERAHMNARDARQKAVDAQNRVLAEQEKARARRKKKEQANYKKNRSYTLRYRR